MKRRTFIFKKFILPKALKYQIHFYTFFHMHFLISPPIITVWAQTLLSVPLDYWNNIKNSLLRAKISLSKSLSGFGTLFQMALYFPAFYVFLTIFKLFWCLETSSPLPYLLLKVLDHFSLSRSNSNSVNHTQILLLGISLIP